MAMVAEGLTGEEKLFAMDAINDADVAMGRRKSKSKGGTNE
jgi:hypothetical protein